MIEELDEIISVPLNPTIRAWKEKGDKIIGCLCCYVPEEIIYAAGILPYRIRATGCRKSLQGDLWMSTLNCSFARSCLEFALDGTYGFLDGLVASDSCGHAHRLYDNWRFSAELPFMHFLTVPHKTGDSAVAWYREEIANFKNRLEHFSGIAITEESIEKATEVYNETRRLLRELYELRRSDHPPITGLESQKLVLAAMSMPKDQYNKLLSKYLEEIGEREPLTKYRARLMVLGSALDDPAFIKIIEDLGGLVVTDALCFGSRYLWEPVRIGRDILVSLAKSYLNRAICPRMMDQHESLFTLIKEMVQSFKVDGIIFEKMQYCDIWGGESLFLEKKLKASNIPFLSLQRDHVMTSSAQTATRVEAFIEMVSEVIG